MGAHRIFFQAGAGARGHGKSGAGSGVMGKPPLGLKALKHLHA